MSKPVFYYDGTCKFCRLLGARWRRSVGERVTFVPFPSGERHASSEYVDAEGAVWRGAEGVFRLLGGTGLWCYRRVPSFAILSEAAYRLVSSCRVCAYKMTRWMFRNNDMLPPV